MPDTTEETAPVFGEALTKTQFNELLQIIEDGHRFCQFKDGAPHCKHIKYVEPILDLRDMRVFRVEFRGLAGVKTFDFRDESQPMYDRIREWLEGGQATC